MKRWLTVLFWIALFLVGCSAAPRDEEDDESGSDDAAQALLDGDDGSRLADLALVPRGLGTSSWAIYAVAPAKSGDAVTQVVAVDHGAEDLFVVFVDLTRRRLDVHVAPGVDVDAALAALGVDLASFADTNGASAVSGTDGSSPTATQSLHVLGGPAQLGIEVFVQVMKRAGTVMTETAAKRMSAAARKAAAEEASVFLYTLNEEYTRYNRFLREGVVPRTAGWGTKKTAEARVATLKSALESLPASPGVVHRWTKFGLGEDAAASTKSLRKQLSKLTVGGTWSDPAFMSATTNDSFANILPHASFRFEIRGRSGRIISQFSHYPNENEILFMPGTKFKVVDVRGEWVSADRWQKNPPIETWRRFYDEVKRFFPYDSDSTLDWKYSIGKVPNLVVTLEEQ